MLALDVIEHLDDDRAAVGRLGDLARPDGYVVVSVPGRPDLFSESDAIQGHRRRYLPDTLESAFQVADLELEQIFWWGAWMVPLTAVARPPQSHGHESTAKAPPLSPAPSLAGPLAMKAAYAIDGPGARRQAPRRYVPLRRRSPRSDDGRAVFDRRTGANMSRHPTRARTVAVPGAALRRLRWWATWAPSCC